ncbi:MAG: permease prefix domain 1-containing protein, partial [Candidatus Weimeria sp.]
IRNYLESMFARLPNTPDVIRAKCELGQMMEDKYNELISDGESDNEAVARVISEFGNLDELGDALGISEILNEEKKTVANTRELSYEDASEYLSCRSRSAFLHGLGTFSGIVCPAGVILAATSEHASRSLMAAGVVFLLAAIAVCITLHTYAGLKMGSWHFMNISPCTIDYSTAGLINDQRRSTHDSRVLQNTVAVLLICTCYIPLVFMHMVLPKAFIDGAGVVIMLIMVALAVLMLTVSVSREGGYRKLLSIGGSDVTDDPHIKSQVFYSNRIVGAIMSVYWPTVVCIYLIISFLCFSWGISWIIWPVAAVVYSLLKAVFGVHREDM